VKKNGGTPSVRRGAMGRPSELHSRESHSTVAQVQTLKGGGGHYDSFPRQKHSEGRLQDSSRRWSTLPSFDDSEGELQGSEQAGDGSNGSGGVTRCSTLTWLRARQLVATRQW
jgi:hypothetical protein